jgi:hypothetical protein
MANVAKQQERIKIYERARDQLVIEADIVLRQLTEIERHLRIEYEILDEMATPVDSNDSPDDNTIVV